MLGAEVGISDGNTEGTKVGLIDVVGELDGAGDGTDDG